MGEFPGSLLAALAGRLSALKPRGRIQRAVQLTKEQRRALNTEQKRQQRAREGQLVAPTQQFMAELARYDLPLVQLLMAEYALNPANAGAPGRMRLHFLEQYATTCHTPAQDTVCRGARSERPKVNFAGGPSRRNTEINGGGKAPKIPLVHCLGDFGANGREPSQRQL